MTYKIGFGKIDHLFKIGYRDLGLEKRLLEYAQTGDGVNYNNIPEPFIQKADDCAILTLVNGVNVYMNDFLKKQSVDDFVDKVRKRVYKNSGTFETNQQSKKAARLRNQSRMHLISEEFPYLGIPLKTEHCDKNPISITNQLFKKNRFLGFQYLNIPLKEINTNNPRSSNSPHNITLIPLSNPTEERFVAYLDSLRGKDSISVSQYIALFKNLHPDFHPMRIYEVGGTNSNF